MVASLRYLEISNPDLQMIGSRNCDVFCLYSSISEEFLHSIILRPKNQLESCQPSSQYV